MAMEDENILFLLRQRSEQGLDEIQKKYGQTMLQIARGVCGSREDAEEAVNDVLAGVWTSPPPDGTLLGPWVYRAARNQALNRVRGRNAAKRRAEVLPLDELTEALAAESGDGGELPSDSADIAAVLNDFLAGLDTTSRIIFLRRYWFSDSVADIARRTGLTSNAVSLRLSRMRAALALRLKEKGVCL